MHSANIEKTSEKKNQKRKVWVYITYFKKYSSLRWDNFLYNKYSFLYVKLKPLLFIHPMTTRVNPKVKNKLKTQPATVLLLTKKTKQTDTPKDLPMKPREDLLVKDPLSDLSDDSEEMEDDV